LHEIDPQKALQGIGQSIGGSRLIFFFSSQTGLRVLEADWSAMVEAPLKTGSNGVAGSYRIGVDGGSTRRFRALWK
jgi:hypothetical protein